MSEKKEIDDIIIKLQRLNGDKMNYIHKIIEKLLFEQAKENKNQTRIGEKKWE